MCESKPHMYIYHLPYDERRKLCFLLDQQNKWEDLGLNQMHFDEITVDSLKREVFRGNSPSNELLTMWGHLNHTVTELFILFNRMGFYQGMTLLKNFVDNKYHVLIKEDNLEKAINRMQIEDNKIPNTNFDKHSIKCLTKPINFEQSNECNETGDLGRRAAEKEVNGPQHISEKNINNPARSPLPRLRKESTKVLTACVAESAGATPQIPYEELEIATDRWSTNRILGQGGFGTVFRGIWKCTQVAIKRLETKENTRKDLTEQIRQSVTELHCLNAYRHDNILPLYGYSIGGQHPCLVYQYMPGGSLDIRIRTKDETKTLSWPTRLNIAIGTARGLQFLHTTLHGNKPLIHGDIKSANILLDPMDQPRIGDFGLAREGPERHYTHIKVSRVHGTLPYLPDEFLRSKEFSTKIDTYSFGVVMFELATALSAGDKRLPAFLKDYIVNYPAEELLKVKDARAPGGEFVFREIVRIGKMCVAKRAKERPEMVQALVLLEKVAEGEPESSEGSSGESSEESE